MGSPSSANTPNGLPKIKVEVTNADRSLWQDWQSTLGLVKSVKVITIKAATSGRIVYVQKSGTHVKQGDILVQLENGKELAQLDAKLATLDRTHRDYKRAHELTKQNVSSSATLQSAETDVRLAQADVAFQRAVLADFTIRAPFSGEVGFHDLIAGQRIDLDQTLFGFQDTEQLSVEFSIPVDFVNESVDGLSVKVESRTHNILLTVPVSAANNIVDSDTNTIRMRAKLPHRTDLRPGMSLRILYVTRQMDNVITLPDIALVDSAYGASVFVVGPDNVVQQRFVQVKGSNRGHVAVSGDVHQGDTIVVTGQMRLYPGAVVDPQPFRDTTKTNVSTLRSDG